MTIKYLTQTLCSAFLISSVISCQNPQSTEQKKSDHPTASDSSTQSSFTSTNNGPHQYGGWYCPDNFGFEPVDIQKFKEVPVIADRLPTKEELNNNMSLIEVDIMKYPDAKALKIELPRVARVYSERLGKDELAIVIQAIVVQNDTIVGYRFVNGGNGSARMKEISFVSNDEVAAMGSQPFYFSKTTINASTKDIWNAMRKSDYFKQLGKKFKKQNFFSSEWDSNSGANLNLNTKDEIASGFVGMMFGSYYMHIDYDRNGFHYSEKLLLVENPNDQTTKLCFASGPFPKNYEKEKLVLDKWIAAIKKSSENK